jgi:hypothetical protein
MCEPNTASLCNLNENDTKKNLYWHDHKFGAHAVQSPNVLISFQSVTVLQRKNVSTFCEMGGKREAQIVSRN